jgi:hypothetical protein
VNFRRRGLAHFRSRTLIVHTRDGRSFRGVLAADHADVVVLDHAFLLDLDQRLGGQVVLLKANISWCQDVTGMNAANDVATPFDDSFDIERPATRGARP